MVSSSINEYIRIDLGCLLLNNSNDRVLDKQPKVSIQVCLFTAKYIFYYLTLLWRP